MGGWGRSRGPHGGGGRFRRRSARGLAPGRFPGTRAPARHRGRQLRHRGLGSGGTAGGRAGGGPGPAGRMVPSVSGPWSVAAHVAEALAAGRPVVALETTLVTQGLPPPDGVSAAAELEAEVRAAG